MKLLILLFALANLFTLTRGSCTASDAPCQEGSGACFEAVQLGLAGNLREAVNVGFYGKYCGNLNKCQAVRGSKSKSKSSGSGSASYHNSESYDSDEEENGSVCEIPKSQKSSSKSSSSKSTKSSKSTNGSKSTKGYKSTKSTKSSKSGSHDADPCPAIPCDDLDTFCSVHDACLDAQLLVTPPPEGERLMVPERCNCDVNFVYDLVLQAALAGGPTYLCDDAFYTVDLPIVGVPAIDLLGHEAHFMAAPFCCNILESLDGGATMECENDEATDSEKFAVASAWCQGFVAQFAAMGIHVCGPPPPMPEWRQLLQRRKHNSGFWHVNRRF